MTEFSSDAFVFFGATGDLAHKQIFPALYAMVKGGTLDVPVIGVARSARNEYEQGTWGPHEVEDRIEPPDYWNNPTIKPAPVNAAVPAV
jgi:glucose-6-phosphate 1-dehydrogenase